MVLYGFECKIEQPNQGVQRTPLARCWAGRDSPATSLRLTDDPTTRNLQPLLATETRAALAVSRTQCAWHLPRASVLHPSHALPAAQLTPGGERWLTVHTVALKRATTG